MLHPDMRKFENHLQAPLEKTIMSAMIPYLKIRKTLQMQSKSIIPVLIMFNYEHLHHDSAGPQNIIINPQFGQKPICLTCCF